MGLLLVNLGNGLTHVPSSELEPKLLTLQAGPPVCTVDSSE